GRDRRGVRMRQAVHDPPGAVRLRGAAAGQTRRRGRDDAAGVQGPVRVSRRGGPPAGITGPRPAHAGMWYRLLADLIVAIHTSYVGFVVVGQVLILVGVTRGWRWVRNFWFRVAHLVAIAIVAAEALFDVACPLTVWEDRVREWGGQAATGGTFIG